MPEFAPGESKTAVAPITVKPAGLNCEAELFLGPDDMTKVATSGRIPFVSTGVSQDVRLPVVMPAAEGTYHVYADVYAEGLLIAAYQATEDVIIAPPIPTERIFSPIGGAVIVNWEDFPVSYPTVHDAKSGQHIGASGYIGQVRDEWGWLVSRGFLVLETRTGWDGLPEDCTIISAALSLYFFRLDLCETVENIVIQTGSYYRPSSEPVLADFDHRYYSGNGGSISTAALHPGYNDIPFNKEGLDFIKKTGDRTRLAIRSSKDINSIAPSRSEQVGAYLGPDSAYPPILTVTIA